MKKLLLWMLLLLVATPDAVAETYNGVAYSTSGDIVPGELTSQFSKARSYADSKNIPLVVVWANPGCGFCSYFESSVLASKKVRSWMATRKYVFVFCLGKDTSDGSAAWSYTKCNAYPMCRVHWKRNTAGKAVNLTFCGRVNYMLNATPGVSSGTSYEVFMSLVDKLVGDYAGGSGSSDSASGGTSSGGASSGGSSSGGTTGTSAEKQTYVLKVTASGGGTVKGGGNYRAGVKAYLSATAKSGYVFSGWYSGATLLSQEKSFGYVMTAADTAIVGKFIAKDDDAVEVSCPLASQYTKGVSIEPVAVSVRGNSLPSVSVTGLPTGLSYKGGEIAGKPSRSGVYVTKVTAKTAGGASLTKTYTVVVSAFGEYYVKAPCEATDGTVSGQGVYVAGKKVTLRMTVKKGVVFEGWYEGAMLLSSDKSYTFTMPSNDVTLTPRFVTAEDDIAAVSLLVDDYALDASTVLEKTATCGVKLSWDLIAGGRSATKVSFSNLPPGLTYNADTRKLEGAPTAAKRYSTQVKVQTASGNVRTFRVAFTVEALPAWAVGTFYGGCEYEGKVGQASLTVSSAGKVSGKLIAAGSSHSFSATGLDSLVKGVVTFRPSLTSTRTLTLTLKQDGDLGRVSGGDANGVVLEALQDVWGRKDLKVPVFAGGTKTPVLEFSNGVKIKIGQKGAVKVGGTLGKAPISGTAQLVAASANGQLTGEAQTVLSAKGASLPDGYYGAEVDLILSDADNDGKIETVLEGRR